MSNLSPAAEKQQKLTAKINDADRAYWQDGKPKMADATYDRLLAELGALEHAHPELNRTASPTQRIGGKLLSEFESVPHAAPMLSLDNIFDLKELETRLRHWWEHGAREFVVEPKVDGLACDLKYEGGVMTRALNRGNGVMGNDVTANVRTIKTVPLQIKDQQAVHIRGEVYMTFADFKKLNERLVAAGEKPMSNPRAAANGALKQLDSKECAKRGLSFLPYHIVGGNMGDQMELHHKLTHDLGFAKLPLVRRFTTVEDTIEYIVKFEALKRDLPFPADGAVVKVSQFGVRSEFPDATRAVRWAYAYKYAPEEAETLLKSITIQVGRTGALAPVAELEPVECGGKVNERASIFNENYIAENDIREGDTVVIANAGEIIPTILRVVMEKRPKGSVPFRMPDKCPTCRTTVVRKQLQQKGKEGSEPVFSAVRYCPNLKCPSVIKGTLGHWCGKEAADIEDVGPALLDILVDKMKVTGVDDMYALLKVHNPFVGIDIGPEIARRFVAGLQRSKDCGMEAVLVGWLI